ncbi:hypothetical protein J6590_000987 [Homalodisca vitripennis]|nr:hypothetical protein J6590_000987 [Homalodisca vitripennis]
MTTSFSLYYAARLPMFCTTYSTWAPDLTTGMTLYSILGEHQQVAGTTDNAIYVHRHDSRAMLPLSGWNYSPADSLRQWAEPRVHVFKSFFLRMYEPINLYEYIINEALLLLEKAHSSEGQKDCSLLDDKDTDCVKDFVSKLSEIFPEMVKIEPDPHLVDRLHQTSKEIIQRENKKCKESRNDFRPSNRGGFSLHRERGRARGGIGYHQRGRGASSDVSSERRGRFSVANQRDKGGEGSSERPARDLSGGHSDSKERRGSNRGKRNIDHTNWRQRN